MMRGLRRMLITLALALAGIYALLCVLVWLLQGRLVYYPASAPRTTPAALGLAFEDLTLATRDGERLHAWFLPAANAHGTIVHCHGNAGSIENRLEIARTFVSLGWSILLFDYRGYGGSSGTPDEEGTYLDAEAAFDAALERTSSRRVVAFGESLGGGVAIELALRRPIAALIVEDTFTSMADMAARVYPWLPARLLTRYRYDSIAKVGRIQAPKLFVHSPDDELVPFEMCGRLFTAAAEPKRQLTTSGGHSAGGFARKQDWVAEVGSFLAGPAR